MSERHVSALIKPMHRTQSTTKLSHGGFRPGAGRKKSGKKLGGPHRQRPALSSATPVHCSLRTVKSVPRLRQRRVYDAIRRVLVRFLGQLGFRIVHLSIQHNHLHFLVEAASKARLTSGMQSLAINLARAINKVFRRIGKVFAFRYHATQVKTDRYARNVLAYVLNNWRHHNEDRRTNAAFDVYSTALSFEGWTIKLEKPRNYDPLPVSPPRTRLLKSDWELYGRLVPTEVPGTPF